MSKTVQFKRGNANVSASYVGAQGEITVNTDNYTLNVHDGTTPGGYSILNTNVSNIGNLVVTNQTITGTSSNTDITLSPTNANVVLTSNLVTPNIIINRYTVQSTDGNTSLTLPSTAAGANIELVNTFSNITLTVLDSDTNDPYTLSLDRDSYLTLPGYIKSSLGGGEIQFGGEQGVLVYADFGTGHTGISLSDIGATDIFANGDLRLSSNYSGISKQWIFGTNGTLSSSGNLSTANLLVSHISASNTVQARTLSNSDLKLTATDGTYESSIYLWANNQRMSFNTVSNAFDFNFNGQLSATDFTASKNSNVGYSFYAEGGDYSGFRHTSGPPDLISIVHEGNVFAGFYGNYTTQLYGNLVVSSDGETFGSFPDAYVQVYSNVDTYSQFVLQNINDGSSASTDVVVTADNGNDSTYYINMGILGSNHAAPDFFGDIQCFDDGYLLVVGNDATGGLSNVGNLLLGSTNGIVKTFVGNIAEANVVTTVSEGLLSVNGNVSATYFIGNGSQLTGITGTSSYSDANVVSLLASFGSNIITTTGNIIADNLIGTTRTYANTGIFGYGTDGSGLIGAPIVISGNSTTSIIGTNGIANNVSSNLTIKTLNSNISLQISGADKTWVFDTTGNLTAPGTILGNLRTDETVIALGDRAGSSNQGNLSVAIGSQAGQTDQGIQATAVGAGAGSTGQAAGTVAVGTNAGAVNQGLRAVAVGSLAGSLNQGEYAVAIGNFAGGTNQANNSIILNATGSSLDSGTSGFFVSPIASNTAGNVLQYNTSTKELSYSDTISISGNVTAGNIITIDNITASNITGTLITAAQPNITSVGTLSSLLVAGQATVVNLEVTSGALTTITSGNAYVFNTGATRLSMGGAAAEVSIGAATGNTTINHNLITTGNITTGNILTDGYFYANGTAVTFGNNYGDSNVVTLLSSLDSNVISSTANITTTANVSANNISATRNLTVGTFLYANVLSAPSGVLSLTSANISMTGVVNFNAAANVAVDGNITAPNFIATSNVVSSGAEITTASVDTLLIRTADFTGNITSSTDLILKPTGKFSVPVTGGAVEFDVASGNVVLPSGVYTGDLSVTGNILQSSGTVSFGNTATITTSNYQIGYRDVPQVIFTSNATLSLTDAGKHYYSANSANVITVPNNATVSFNVGTAVTVVQEGTANLTISPDSGVTLYLTGNSTSGTRTLGNYGMATLLKVATDTWFISGTGVN